MKFLLNKHNPNLRSSRSDPIFNFEQIFRTFRTFARKHTKASTFEIKKLQLFTYNPILKVDRIFRSEKLGFQLIRSETWVAGISYFLVLYMYCRCVHLSRSVVHQELWILTNGQLFWQMNECEAILDPFFRPKTLLRWYPIVSTLG